MKAVVKKILNIIFKIFKVKDNKILFQCGRGMIDGSPKAIYNYIKKHHKEYELIWIVDKDANTTGLDKKEYCYSKSLKSLYHLSTAKYWIRSESIGSILNKKDSQIYIQAWHGHGALKRMSYDVTGVTLKEPLEHTKEWDYLLTNDPLDDTIMTTSTGYNRKKYMIGTPLTDYVLINANSKKFKKEMLEKLNINNDKPIILYAPTFREDDLESDIVDLKINKLKELKDYNILLRLHPLIRNKIDKSIYEENDNMINCCSYPDITDILCVTDILISDYSSIIYEYSILEKPIIFYAYDLEKYQQERGFYIKYPEDLPGKVVYSEEELYNTLLNIKEENKEYTKKIKKFNKRFNYLNDGKVCKRFVDLLKTEIN